MTPFQVKAPSQTGFNYTELAKQADCSIINEELLNRFERLTGQKPHRLLTRGIFFSHRDLDVILDRFERREPFFIYTSRAPSGDTLHIGHTIPLLLCKYLQDVFDVPVLI